MGYPFLDQKGFDEVFRMLSKTGLVFPKASKSKDSNYDSYRDTGYVKSYQNGLPFKYISQTISPNSLTWKQIGLQEAGAIQVIVRDEDADLIKISHKVEIENVTYYAFSDAVGNRVQIYPSQFSNFSKIILFRENS